MFVDGLNCLVFQHLGLAVGDVVSKSKQLSNDVPRTLAVINLYAKLTGHHFDLLSGLKALKVFPVVYLTLP
jgi:hypothetical protein